MSNTHSSFAIFTDIHGNQTAFDAVLNDINELESTRGAGTARRVCLGDSFDGGPDPQAVYKTLENLKCPHLRGNHEEYLFQCARNPRDEKFLRPLWKFVPWTVARLGDSLQSLEASVFEHWSAEDAPLRAVHASLANNNRVPDFFTQQSALSPNFVERWLEDLKSETQIVFNGHSHYLGRHVDPQGRSLWFNCGSVGYPFVEKLPEHPDAPLATWVWVEVFDDARVVITPRRVPYSSDELLHRYIESGALEACAPFSYAIVAQSLFNQDVVYPFFQSVKNKHVTPAEMAYALNAELKKQNVFERINRLLRRAGLNEVQKD